MTVSSLHTVCIGLGSNLGYSRKILANAWQELDAHQQITTLQLSAPFVTRPVGMESQNWFVNGAGVLQTSLSPLELLTVLQKIEQQSGRKRYPELAGYQDRTLDLDMLLLDDVVMQSPLLTLPHPEMHTRGFVLVPLAEIAPSFVHPVEKKTISQLLSSLKSRGLTGDVHREEW